MHDSFPTLFEESQAIPLCFPSFSGNGEEARRAWEKQENASQVKKRLPTFSSAVTLPPLSYLTQSINGQVSEWSNEHAWKVCVPQTGTEGSNPSLSAINFPSQYIRHEYIAFFVCRGMGKKWGKLMYIIWRKYCLRKEKCVFSTTLWP